MSTATSLRNITRKERLKMKDLYVDEINDSNAGAEFALCLRYTEFLI